MRSDDATAKDANCNLFKTENIMRIVYDPSEASIGWSVVTRRMADQFFYIF